MNWDSLAKKLVLGLSITAFVTYQFVSAFSYTLYVGPIGSAIIAAGVTLTITLTITMWQKELETMKAKQSLIGALSSELRTIREIIQDRKNKAETYIKETGNYLLVINVSEDYFTVFSKNADKIGLLSKETAEDVIRTYIEAKGLFDDVRGICQANIKTIEMSSFLAQMEHAGQLGSLEYQGIWMEFQRKAANAEKAIKLVLNDSAPNVIAQIDKTLIKMGQDGMEKKSK